MGFQTLNMTLFEIGTLIERVIVKNRKMETPNDQISLHWHRRIQHQHYLLINKIIKSNRTVRFLY